jgi:hypothetical protein
MRIERPTKRERFRRKNDHLPADRNPGHKRTGGPPVRPNRKENAIKRRHKQKSERRAGLTALSTVLVALVALTLTITIYHVSVGEGHNTAGALKVEIQIPQELPHLPAPAPPLQEREEVQTTDEGHGSQSVPRTPPAPAPSGGIGPGPHDHAAFISWALAQVRKAEEERVAREARERAVAQIEIYLAERGSPMVGTGECFVANGERTGIPPALSVGIAETESTCGKQCYNGQHTHNAWGMIGFPCGWPTWEEGITANFDFLVLHFGCPQTMYDCPGYCQGNTTMDGVNNVQRYIEVIEP